MSKYIGRAQGVVANDSYNKDEADARYATAAQGSTANSAVQPGDNISTLTNNSNYATQAYVDQAESDAVATANAYTDTEIANIDIPDPITKSATAPSNPTDGDLWYDTASKILFVYNSTSSSWVVVGDQTLPVVASGGSVTTSGVYKIHTFTSSGTFTVTQGGDVEYIVVGGGGGGGANRGGGGGAGGYRSSVSGEASGGGQSAEPPLTVTPGNYSITIGAGGAASAFGGSDDGGQGSNTIFASITSLGGGLGRSDDESGESGGSGSGSGGGANTSFTGGSGTAGQGFSGGSTYPNSTFGNPGAGGGGAAGGGASANTNPVGGAGVTSAISGSAIMYAVGGSGGSGNSAKPGCTDPYGGGQGGWNNTNNATAGTTNRGGGGGGGSNGSQQGKAGGSGVVIIRYKA
jgi:hypothetical protein